MINLLEDCSNYPPRCKDHPAQRRKEVTLETGADPVRVTRASPTQERSILRHLMDAGDWVSKEELWDVLLDHRLDEDGGFDSTKALEIIVFRVRDRLADGFMLENRWGYDYRLVIDWEAFERASVLGAERALANE